MKHPIAMFVSFLITVAVVTGIWVSLVLVGGRGVCEEPSVTEMLAYKLERLKHSQSPRFVILSGSNAQHNLDCDELARRLGMDVVCAGVIYKMPVRFYVKFVEDVLEAGDVLYLPLEPSAYTQTFEEEVLSPFGVSVMLGIYPRAIETLSFFESVRLFATRGLGWLQFVQRSERGRRADDPVYSREMYDIVQSVPGTAGARFIKTRGDTTWSTDAYFDPATLLGSPYEFSSEFRHSFDDLVRMAESRGVKVILGTVPWYSYPREEDTSGFLGRIKKLGVPFCGNPAAYCLPYGLFTEFSLHCNEAGRKYFTYETAKALCRELGLPFEETPHWPLVAFEEGVSTPVDIPQAADCIGRTAFAEIILDRGSRQKAACVREVLIDDKPVAFQEIVEHSKNRLWVEWRSDRPSIRLEIRPNDGFAPKVERVWMEADRAEALAKLTTFNAVSADFAADTSNPRLFQATNCTRKENFLKVRIPEWTSNRWMMKLKVKAPRHIDRIKLLGRESLRSIHARDEDGFSVFEARIMLNESSLFVDETGTAEAGIMFRTNAFSPGETLEVLELVFERI